MKIDKIDQSNSFNSIIIFDKNDSMKDVFNKSKSKT